MIFFFCDTNFTLISILTRNYSGMILFVTMFAYMGIVIFSDNFNIIILILPLVHGCVRLIFLVYVLEIFEISRRY